MATDVPASCRRLVERTCTVEIRGQDDLWRPSHDERMDPHDRCALGLHKRNVWFERRLDDDSRDCSYERMDQPGDVTCGVGINLPGQSS